MKVQIAGKNGSKIVDLNRRRAIREYCLNCSGWILKEVRECEFTDCPLYPYRQGNGKHIPKARAKAIRKHCLWCMNGQRKEVELCPSTDCSLYPYRKVRIDRSVEIKSESEIDHIDASFEEKIETPDLSMADV